MQITPAQMTFWAVTWNGAGKTDLSANVDMAATQNIPDLSKILTDYEGPASLFFGQVTPPSEHNNHKAEKFSGKRADSSISQNTSNAKATRVTSRGSSNFQSPKTRTKSTNDRPSKRARMDSQASEDEDEVREGPDGSKREIHRERNRAAAAKCRATKKKDADDLEETFHRQSKLHIALKQTLTSLRDELSLLRTQALQHTFCTCRAIQDYNMRKARDLAAESTLGNPVSNRSPSLKSVTSESAMSPVMKLPGLYHSRSHSVQSLDDIMISRVMSPLGERSRPDSFVRGTVVG